MKNTPVQVVFKTTKNKTTKSYVKKFETQKDAQEAIKNELDKQYRFANKNNPKTLHVQIHDYNTSFCITGDNFQYTAFIKK